PPATHPLLPLIPYTTLFRSEPHEQPQPHGGAAGDAVRGTRDPQHGSANHDRYEGRGARARIPPQALPLAAPRRVDPLGRARCLPDRKSTRLNSSHEWISYAV